MKMTSWNKGVKDGIYRQCNYVLQISAFQLFINSLFIFSKQFSKFMHAHRATCRLFEHEGYILQISYISNLIFFLMLIPFLCIYAGADPENFSRGGSNLK